MTTAEDVRRVAMAAQPYTPEELRGVHQPDMARVRATAKALQLAQERLSHPAAALGMDLALKALQRQREACARVARGYPANTTLGDQLGRVVRATPLVGVRP
jgi:hypothetical protein